MLRTMRNRCLQTCGLAYWGCAHLLWLGACAPSLPRITLSRAVARPRRSVVLFFVDGLDRSRFDVLRKRGLLPNIERRFIHGGVTIEHAIVSLPPITYPNAVSLLTGRFPGHHGVLGNQWFDRRTLEYHDYDSVATYLEVNGHFRAPTLYEILADHFTISVQCHTRRGATQILDGGVPAGIDWVLGGYERVDAGVGAQIEQVGRIANRVRRWPSVLLYYFPGVDAVGHRFGPDSARYLDAVRNVDAQIGRITGTLEAAGLADVTDYVLVTDHGHVPCRPDRTLDLVRWLRDRCGLRVHEGPVPGADYAARFAQLDRVDAVVVNGAYRRFAIHLRGPSGWAEPPAAEALRKVLAPGIAGSRNAYLHEVPGVGLVCVREGENRVKIRSRDGSALVERRTDGASRRYRLTAEAAGPSADALGYHRDPVLASFVDTGWHASREWLAATARSPYPDFVPQVVEMFDSPRAGDIVVFAADDWAFSNCDRGGHGSCLAADMCVRFFFAGPDLPAGTALDHARLVDIMPTVLELLGEQRRLADLGPLDGVSLAGQLKGSASPSKSKMPRYRRARVFPAPRTYP